MKKDELALQLTLATIAQRSYYIEQSTNQGVGDAIAAIYNTILKSIIASGQEE